MQVPPFKATLAALAILALAIPVEARITRLVVEHTETLGHDGYQRLTGHAYGELDPKLPLNAIITDLQFAPRNARGKVEYVATFALIKPADMAKASGVLMYSVVNRGGGSPSVSLEGHVSLVSGWQGDVIPSAINQTIQVPTAHNADGSSLVGPFVIRFVN